MICSLMCIAMAGQIITAPTTAYSQRETCPDRPCITASGALANERGIACPRSVKLGTIAVIDAIAYTCIDRTAKRIDGKYDLWKSSYEEAIKYGVQTKNIILIN